MSKLNNTPSGGDEPLMPPNTSKSFMVMVWTIQKIERLLSLDSGKESTQKKLKSTLEQDIERGLAILEEEFMKKTGVSLFSVRFMTPDEQGNLGITDEFILKIMYKVKAKISPSSRDGFIRAMNKKYPPSNF